MITENFTLVNASGLKLEARIDRDESRATQPLVFIVGGFASEAFEGSMSQRALVPIFLKHGFAVMRMNFRGNGNSDGDVRHSTITAGLEDLHTATDYIKTLPWVEYVGISGSSHGSAIALAEVAEKPSLDYKFLILQSARIDLTDYYESNGAIDFKAWKRDGYTLSSGRLHNYSMYTDSLKYKPWEVAGRIRITTLIVHGDRDETCPYDFAVKLHGLVKSSELATVSGLGHKYDERVGEIIDGWLAKINRIYLDGQAS
ncbi:MAG: lysophospholipase [Alphaproteobacteria bacterium]|nr:lysophospholipase [Alphaproteobacteria bacterium]